MLTGDDRLLVVGAGTMGAGIAALACREGVSTVLCDVDGPAVEAGLQRVRSEFERLIGRGRLSPEDAALAEDRLQATSKLDAVAGVSVVVEAIPERLDWKADLFRRLAAALPGAVLASNTSSIPIASLAEASGAAERVVGLHFFNPPAAMRLVELISTPLTQPRAAAAARALAERLGKVVVAVADGPGFLVNRCARPYYLEALRLVERGVATPWAIDRICEDEGSFPIGPFRLMDVIGMDVSLAVTRSMWELSGGEPRWRPSRIQTRMVAAGNLGRKTGSGFYVYDGNRSSPDVAAEAPARHGESTRMLLHIVAQLVNEAWFAVDDGVAEPADIDRAMTIGLRHPRGPLASGDEIGAERIVAVLRELQRDDEDPARYRVAAGLERTALRSER